MFTIYHVWKRSYNYTRLNIILSSAFVSVCIIEITLVITYLINKEDTQLKISYFGIGLVAILAIITFFW